MNSATLTLMLAMVLTGVPALFSPVFVTRSCRCNCTVRQPVKPRDFLGHP